MPGFVINGGGGPGPNNNVETRRKHRWVFATLEPLDNQVLLILKEAARPHFTLEEPEMHHNQEKAYFAGKQSWEACKLMFYDGEQSPDVSRAMWNWVNVTAQIPQANVAKPNVYKKDASLQMLGSAGETSETWRMFGCWPQDTNWNNLDYSDTEIQLIEVTMRFDRAVRQ